MVELQDVGLLDFSLNLSSRMFFLHSPISLMIWTIDNDHQLLFLNILWSSLLLHSAGKLPPGFLRHHKSICLYVIDKSPTTITHLKYSFDIRASPVWKKKKRKPTKTTPKSRDQNIYAVISWNKLREFLTISFLISDTFMQNNMAFNFKNGYIRLCSALS